MLRSAGRFAEHMVEDKRADSPVHQAGGPSYAAPRWKSAHTEPDSS